MDPLTQGLLGAAAVQVSRVPRKTFRLATLVGALGGMAADLDVFIRSSTNPLLAIQFHRHFTHAIAFIPVGGALVGALLWLLLARGLRKEGHLSQYVLWATVGYATHGLLDCFTSYGTQYFWPFSSQRVSWNLVAVIDPLFTIPLGLGVLFSLRSRRAAATSIGLLCCAIYLGANLLQRSRVESLVDSLAIERGHAVLRRDAHPTLFNNIVWRTLYETPDGKIHIQAVHVGWLGSTALYHGDAVEKLDRRKHFPSIPDESVLARDIDLFDWFSSGFAARDPEDPTRVGDIRYSIFPSGRRALWGIDINPSRPHEHAPFWTGRDIQPGDWGRFWGMIMGDPWADDNLGAGDDEPPAP